MAHFCSHAHWGPTSYPRMLVRMKAFSCFFDEWRWQQKCKFHQESVDELDRSQTYRSPSETPLLGRLSTARQQAQMLSSFLRHGSQNEQLQEMKRQSGQTYVEDKKYFSCSKHLGWAFQEIWHLIFSTSIFFRQIGGFLESATTFTSFQYRHANLMNQDAQYNRIWHVYVYVYI